MATYVKEIDGVQVELPSVTTILGILDKPAIGPWMVKVALEHIRSNKDRLEGHGLETVLEEARTAHKKESEKAKNIGSEVHDIIEKYLVKMKPTYSANHGFVGYTREGEEVEFMLELESAACFNAFRNWHNSNRVEVLELEKALYNLEYGFAGRCDFIGMVNGKKTILDWKTSKAVYDEYRYQVGAYALCEPDVEQIQVLRLDKETGEYNLKDFSNRIEQSKKAFAKLVDVYYHMKKRRLKMDLT